MIPILFEDNHLLVVLKPAGLLSMPAKDSETDVYSICRNYVRIKYKKPGEAYMGLVHRLDRNVSGIMVLARTSKAAARLSEQFRNHTVKKIYEAIVEGELLQHGKIESSIKKDSDMKMAEEGDGDTNALLQYKRIRYISNLNLSHTEIELLSGKFHQIRFQMSMLGHPILGDKKYGGKPMPEYRIALRASFLSFLHPIGKGELRFDIRGDDWVDRMLADF